MIESSLVDLLPPLWNFQILSLRGGSEGAGGEGGSQGGVITTNMTSMSPGVHKLYGFRPYLLKHCIPTSERNGLHKAGGTPFRSVDLVISNDNPPIELSEWDPGAGNAIRDHSFLAVRAEVPWHVVAVASPEFLLLLKILRA